MGYIQNLIKALKDKLKNKPTDKSNTNIDDTEGYINKYNDAEGKSHWFGGLGKKNKP